VTVLSLPVPTAFTAGPHTHAGPVFAYILQGDIENQVEPDPVKTYHPGDFFCEPRMHVHRMLRNLSGTEPAKLIVFQVGDTGKANPAIKTLIEEPLTIAANREARMLTLTVAPGGVSAPHKHPGPVFAYILKGEIENQVDPDQPKTYRAGDFFYEPPLHVHRMLRNLSKTEPAELLIFQMGERASRKRIDSPRPAILLWALRHHGTNPTAESWVRAHLQIATAALRSGRGNSCGSGPTAQGRAGPQL
jgi:quercetin dioxygenase-like cupin family protein